MMGPTEPVVPGVIAYNGDSQRGWNDPPTLSYAGITASKRGPKLDLRKRVSHQEALTGRKVTSPSNQNYNPNLFSQVTKGLSNLVLGEQPQPPVQSPDISPHHSRSSSGTCTPPLIRDNENITGLMQPNTINFFVPPPPTTSVVSPLIPITTNTFYPPAPPTLTTASHISALPPSPPITSPVRILPPSSLGKPLFSPKALNMAPVSSALDTHHVRSNPDILLDPTQQDEYCNGSSKNISSFPETTKNSALTPLIFTPSPTGFNNFTPNYQTNNLGKRSPVLSRGPLPKLYTPPPVTGSGRNSPVPPPPITNNSPSSTPTGVHSGHSTPRSSSPETALQPDTSSRQDSEEFDSTEALNTTVEALEEIILRCNSLLQNKVVDVKKKLEIMKQQWKDKKLSLPVQMLMKSLTKALLDSDTQTADIIHLQLMVDYVGEVKQWMVAIKRLISAVGNVQTKKLAS